MRSKVFSQPYIDLFNTLDLLNYLPSSKPANSTMTRKAVHQYNYHTWANNRFFDHLNELPVEVYEKEVESVFPTISEVIAHVYQVDGLWLSVMSGNSFDKTLTIIDRVKKESAEKSLVQMQKLYAELNHDYQTFLDDIDDFELPITVNHPKHGSLDTTVAQLVQHVVNHGTYHRGNITAMLRQQGHAGIPNDYIYYLFEMA